MSNKGSYPLFFQCKYHSFSALTNVICMPCINPGQTSLFIQYSWLNMVLKLQFFLFTKDVQHPFVSIFFPVNKNFIPVYLFIYLFIHSITYYIFYLCLFTAEWWKKTASLFCKIIAIYSS